jgi:hypothetical protein
MGAQLSYETATIGCRLLGCTGVKRTWLPCRGASRLGKIRFTNITINSRVAIWAFSKDTSSVEIDKCVAHVYAL